MSSDSDSSDSDFNFEDYTTVTNSSVNSQSRIPECDFSQQSLLDKASKSTRLYNEIVQGNPAKAHKILMKNFNVIPGSTKIVFISPPKSESKA